MELVRAGDQNFESFWKQFVAEFGCPWRYTYGYLQYQRAYCGKHLLDDCSFIVVRDGVPLALVPLFLVDFPPCRQLGFGAGFAPSPFVHPETGKTHQRKILSRCYEELETIGLSTGAAKMRMLIDPATNPDSNYLQQQGFLDVSLASALLDLRQDPDTLHAGIRRRYKPMINKAKQNFVYVVSDFSSPDRELFDEYCEMHHKTAGRITRPLQSFEEQYSALLNDEGMLLGIKDGDSFVAISYFFHSALSCYYGSAADDPDYEGGIPLEHSIIWAAAEYYKQRGIPFFELGLQQFGQQLYDFPSKKDLGISFFKRGFGGRIVPMFRGVRYFDVRIAAHEIRENAEKYINSLQFE
ncbi:hypothetical protein SAMN02745704_02382 [Paucidesulfovibrio gracilis DSM 16080]|uniref:Acetyltransferase (GNAT) domain-containing protein n=1 Tax=Paucidesulfovibrio gracilis DSM 16080 TaxID=1121449 RepID=A0A1T4XRA7_9BACT|nr:hypothetical protein [Paucidesulfovibrio gracilis]SKA92064.1 hypothetical protein SAMN02745704_02382 [Paucidesulfovibrio gracilis DSM 16080]